MLPLLKRIGFIAFDQQAANQPLIKTMAIIITIPLLLSNISLYHAT
jgi:hypothetical protein